MKVPARRRGNQLSSVAARNFNLASMKVPARKRRNPSSMLEGLLSGRRLNESPHSKVGKLGATGLIDAVERSRLNESPRPKAGK